MKIRLALLLLLVAAAFAIPAFSRPVVIHDSRTPATPDAAPCDELHAHVDSVLVAETADALNPDGKYGIGKYRAAATFSRFAAYR